EGLIYEAKRDDKLEDDAEDGVQQREVALDGWLNDGAGGVPPAAVKDARPARKNEDEIIQSEPTAVAGLTDYASKVDEAADATASSPTRDEARRRPARGVRDGRKDTIRGVTPASRAGDKSAERPAATASAAAKNGEFDEEDTPLPEPWVDETSGPSMI